MTPILIAAPTEEPVALADMKAWLRLDHTVEDDIVQALIVSARLVVESATRTLLLTQTWRLLLDAWPASREIIVPLAPFRSLAAISVADGSGQLAPLGPEAFSLRTSAGGTRILLGADLPQPGISYQGIAVDVIVGLAGNAQEVPPPLRQAIRMLVARWYENRGDCARDCEQLPPDIALLTEPYRRARLA